MLGQAPKEGGKIGTPTLYLPLAPGVIIECSPGLWPQLSWPVASHRPAFQTRHWLSRHVPSHWLESQPAQACCNESAFHLGKTWWLACKSLFPTWPLSWAGSGEAFLFPFGILLAMRCSPGVPGTPGAGIALWVSRSSGFNWDRWRSLDVATWSAHPHTGERGYKG